VSLADLFVLKVNETGHKGDGAHDSSKCRTGIAHRTNIKPGNLMMDVKASKTTTKYRKSKHNPYAFRAVIQRGEAWVVDVS